MECRRQQQRRHFAESERHQSHGTRQHQECQVVGSHQPIAHGVTPMSENRLASTMASAHAPTVFKLLHYQSLRCSR